MAYTHVSRLTTTSDQVFETVEEFIEFHGSIGENNPLVRDFLAEIEEGGQSVIRTMIYEEETNRAAHKAEGVAVDDKPFTVELVSISE